MSSNHFMVFSIAVFVFAGAVNLAFYLLKSIGLYKLAKSGGHPNAWLAFVPVAQEYIMAHLSKQSLYIKNKFSAIDVIYPILSGIYLFVGFVFPLVFAFRNIFQTGFPYYSMLKMLPVFLAINIFAVFYTAATCFICYHIYKIYDPQNAVLYTVLSALGFSFIFLFVIRNREPAV